MSSFVAKFSTQIALALLILCCNCAQAATFTPNSFSDIADANPGDGVCSTGGVAPVCTLRAAINEANAASNTDIIQLSGGTYILSLAGADDTGLLGDLDILNPVTIQSTLGVLTTVDAGGIDRVFDIASPTGSVIFFGLIIRNGRATTASTFSGGGLRIAGAPAGVQFFFCILENNQASNGGAAFVFGSSVLFQYSILRNNTATGGITNPEGSVIDSQTGTVRFESSSIYNNISGAGFGNRGSLSGNGANYQIFSTTVAADTHVGINTHNSSVLLQNATITNNASVGLAWSSSTGNTLFMRNSIISGNPLNCVINPTNIGDVVDINGNNLDSDNSCGLAASNGNLFVDPLLGPLNTSVLLPAFFPKFNSPVINAGSPLSVLIGNPNACFRYDQQGVDRSTNGPCDIGAVENFELFSDGFE